MPTERFRAMFVKRRLEADSEHDDESKVMKLSEKGRLEIDRTVVWNPARELFRYDLEPRNADGSPCIPNVQRTHLHRPCGAALRTEQTSAQSAEGLLNECSQENGWAHPTPIFIFRGFAADCDRAPVLRLQQATIDRYEATGWSSCSPLWRRRRNLDDDHGGEGGHADAPLDGTEEERSAFGSKQNARARATEEVRERLGIAELRGKLSVKCDYWTTFGIGLQICTTAYRATLERELAEPLTTHLLPPLCEIVFDYMPFFLQCFVANGFCDEDESMSNEHLAQYCHNCSGEDPQLQWYRTHCNCEPVDEALRATARQRQIAVALWSAIHRACADVADLEELTHVN